MHSVPVSPDRAKANAEGAAQGLVICAITGRTYPSGPQNPSSDSVAVPSTPDSAGSAYQPLFPSADLVGHAADMLPRAPRWDGREGPRWHITFAPGAISVGTTDRARQERTLERQQEIGRAHV